MSEPKTAEVKVVPSAQPGWTRALREVAAAPASPPAETGEGCKRQLGNLLARIHRDGGHRVEAVGWEQAVEEADHLIAGWVQRLERPGADMALEPGVPWAGDDERWDDVRKHWRGHADDLTDEGGKIDVSEVDTCVAIALHRAFTIALNALSTPHDADGALQRAARKAGWALMENVDLLPWERRQQVSDIAATLGFALSAQPVSLSEGEARQKLISCIDQWDSEMEYDAEDRASLADDILHAFNGPPHPASDQSDTERMRKAISVMESTLKPLVRAINQSGTRPNVRLSGTDAAMIIVASNKLRAALAEKAADK